MAENKQNTKTPLLNIEHMGKSFGGNEVLRDVSLQVMPGEIVSIIGPSGSGKSTLLRCSTLLEQMDRGTLSYGKDVVCEASDQAGGTSVYADKKKLARIHNHFGLVFQNFNLFPHYTVLKNLTDAQVRVHKIPKEQAERTARSLLDQFGLSEKADAYPCELSGGQQQRVGVARALALRPEILFLDEPTSALDPELTADVLKVLKQLAAEHITMVIVTHELNFAREVSDRIIFLEHGAILEEGSPEELFSSSNTRVRDFIGKLSSQN